MGRMGNQIPICPLTHISDADRNCFCDGDALHTMLPWSIYLRPQRTSDNGADGHIPLTWKYFILCIRSIIKNWPGIRLPETNKTKILEIKFLLLVLSIFSYAFSKELFFYITNIHISSIYLYRYIEILARLYYHASTLVEVHSSIQAKALQVFA